MLNKIVVAMKSIIIYDGKVLIMQRASQDVGAGTWEFVGGKLEFGEELESGLKREILEEAGLEVELEKLLFATTFKTHEDRQVVILNYLSYSKHDKVVLSDEHKNFLWAGKRDMKRLLTAGILRDLEENQIFEQINICE